MIYCVEDDTNIREIEIYTLKSLGLEAEGFEDGKAFFTALENNVPDLVILDVMLPDLDGIEILKRLKSNHKTRDLPVIMATARGAEFEKVQALDIGADDYLAKPFSMIEMAARVKAVLRRCHKDTSSVITVDKLKINEESRTISVNDIEVDLTYKEFELLLLLVKHEVRVYSREQLLDIVWGTDYDGESRTVDVHIRTLRQKLMSMDYIIKTVRGIGYKAEF